MQDNLANARRVSREANTNPEALPLLLAAEERLSRISDAEFTELEAEITRKPEDGVLQLWLGLALRGRERWAEAIEAFSKAIELNVTHWRLGWYIAQSAKTAGLVDVAEQACAAVLKAAPTFKPAMELLGCSSPAADVGSEEFRSGQVVVGFFAHQQPRTKTFLEIGSGQSSIDVLARSCGWSGVVIAPRTPATVAPNVRYVQLDTPVEEKLVRAVERTRIADLDVLSLTDPVTAMLVLRKVDLGAIAPQMFVVSYGERRNQVMRLLAQQGYSPLADEGQRLLAVRFAPIAAEGPAFGTRNFTGLSGKPAYNEIEEDFQQNLHGWVGTAAAEIERIVIVGGCYGLEVAKFLTLYPKAEIHVFEPSRRHFPRLQATYASQPRVKCHRFAVSDQRGTATFHEGSMPGVGSLLPPCDKADANAWVPFEAQETFEVELVTLDTFVPLAGKPIDLLWCDVQGAELQVLRGARETLRRCRSVFLEVANTKMTYRGQCRFPELDTLCHEAGFYLAAIGLCPSGNGTGNAAWLRRAALEVGSEARDTVRACELEVVAPGELARYLARLHPYLVSLNYLPMDREIKVGTVDPLELLTPQRFDLTAKYLYAKHRELGVDSSWARELYHAHIKAFSGGTCREGDGSKASIDDYFRSFNGLLDNIKTNGFDAAKTLVPIARDRALVDGAHRAAACLLFRRPVGVLQFDRSDERFGYEFFRKRGMDDATCDAMALEYCRLRPDTFVVTVFPAAKGRDEELKAILREHGRIVYAREIVLTRQGAWNLVREIYTGEPWAGTWKNGFAGIRGKMEPCFRGDGAVRVFVLQSVSLESVKAAKLKIRALYGVENHSVHINDTHAQTLQLARLMLNRNSIHFLNQAQPQAFPRFVKHLERYRAWLTASGRDPEHFAIDGSAVMAAYGLRDAQDLDVLHFGAADFRAVMPEVNSHNPDAHHHTTTRDDIIFNPANHFYAYGLKFAALHVIRALKAKRNEGKDQRDVVLIDDCDGTEAGAGQVQDGFGKNDAREPKIVGLIPARNEAARLPFCLRALKPYVDAVVYLDDCSDDGSVKLVESLVAECKVEKIIAKTTWHRDEPGDRNALLAAGRAIGGTHFIVIDADEAFTANCARDDYLRRLVLSLRPGDSLVLNWIQLWRSLKHYRFDNSQWTYSAKAFAFCDDGRATYQSGFIHTLRVPHGLKGKAVPVVNYVHGLMHFQFVDWPNLQIKQAWYRCMERVRQPNRTVAEINAQYGKTENETALQVRDVPADWFDGYAALDTSALSVRDERRVREVFGWFREKGVAHFAGLDIWRVDWAALTNDAALAAEIRCHAGGRNSTKPPALTPVARQHMATASRCLGRGDLEGCRTSMEQALGEAPEHPEILCALGNILLLTGNAAEAVSRFEASLRAEPNQPKAWAQLAAAWRKLNKPAGMLTALQHALELDANCMEALRVLAEIHTERGRHREAAGAYRKIAHVAPRDARAAVQLARALAAAGESAEARKEFERALKIDPGSKAARDGLSALATVEQREPAAAMR